jgi:hypothetical protein
MYRCIIFGATVIGVSEVAFGSTETIGPNGVNSFGLRLPNGVFLDGNGVNVGQVETGRVAIPGFDSASNSHSGVVPFSSTTQDGDPADMNDNLSAGHPLQVASIIIGSNAAPPGVARASHLYSSGTITEGIDPGYQDALITTQYLAKLFPFSNRAHLRVINHSWNELQPDLGNVDGNSLLTLGMDWISSEFDVLNVFAGTQDGEQRRVPADNYNGLTIARAEKVGGVFRRVDGGNDNDFFDDAIGERVSVDLIAPGVEIEMAGQGSESHH